MLQKPDGALQGVIVGLIWRLAGQVDVGDVESLVRSAGTFKAGQVRRPIDCF